MTPAQSARDARSAFFVQARSDLELALALRSMPGRRVVPRCHWLHYLQMAVEKFSKGAHLLPGDFELPPKTHVGAHRLIGYLKAAGPTTERLHRALSDKGIKDARQRSAYFQSLAATFRAVEKLAPALAEDGPNAEYPWKATGGNQLALIAPAEYRFDAPELAEPRLEKATSLLSLALDTIP